MHDRISTLHNKDTGILYPFICIAVVVLLAKIPLLLLDECPGGGGGNERIGPGGGQANMKKFPIRI